MKKDLRPTYISPSSYAKKQTIPIDVSLDPRLNSITQNFKIARQNAEFVPIGLGKSIGSFLTTIQNSDPSIISNEISLQLQKKIIPNLSSAETYNLYYEKYTVSVDINVNYFKITSDFKTKDFNDIL